MAGCDSDGTQKAHQDKSKGREIDYHPPSLLMLSALATVLVSPVAVGIAVLETLTVELAILLAITITRVVILRRVTI